MFDRLEDKPLSARAEVVLKRYLSAAHRDDPANGCPLPAIVGEVSTTTPQHKEVLAEQLNFDFAPSGGSRDVGRGRASLAGA
jgi:TetR/AcrR family transcriptional repressor of nem operon